MKIIDKFERKFHHILDTTLRSSVARSTTPFATHMPALMLIGRMIRPKTILELGSGKYSSKLFLDRDFFPEVEFVHSYENDSEWAHVVTESVGGDSRFRLLCTGEPISNSVALTDIESYDLIFIDDSIDSDERCATIGAIVGKTPIRSVVVIHDYEHYPYRKSSSKMKNKYRFDSLNPNTGVLWNGCQLEKNELLRANDLIADFFKEVDIGSDDTCFEQLRTLSSRCKY